MLIKKTSRKTTGAQLLFPLSDGARTSRQPGHFQVTKVLRQVIRCKRQRSKGARSLRGQKILKPAHRMHFFLKNVDDFYLVALKTQVTNAADCLTVKMLFKAVRYGNNFYSLFTLLPKQCKAVTFPARSLARAVDLPARLFDLVRPGVASPLFSLPSFSFNFYIISTSSPDHGR